MKTHLVNGAKVDLSLARRRVKRGMVLERANLDNKDLILSIFERSPDFFQKVEGCDPSLRTVEDAILGTPSHITTVYMKEFLIIRRNGEPIGTVELHCNHPEVGVCYIGLLLLREDLRGRGIGREAYRAVERYLRDHHSCLRVRLGVSDDNDVSGFWAKLGFCSNGRDYSWIGERKATNVVEYEKWIGVSPSQELGL